MNPVLVMVGYVIAEEPAQMAFIDRNNVIEKFAGNYLPTVQQVRSAKALGSPSALLSTPSLSGNP